tara:strand:+ start:8199 stop:9734 length:1536 start_codon:yes stop_codon:yes gene_type:complete
MYLIFSASKDNYITNKIISTSLSASDANVGQASTLDLFKLYDETSFSGYTGSYAAPTEFSRILVAFNTTAISSSISPYAELDGFKAYLSLKDINGSQIAPKDFNAIVYPLSQSWEEGNGTDIYSFNDLGRSNWLTSSYSNSAEVLWNQQGARAEGYLNSTDIDVISSGSIAGGASEYLYSVQNFVKGHEDLFVDITTQLSATMAGFLPDNGFLIAFSGSEETDSASRFVKRFGARHARDPYLRPTIIVAYDNHKNDARNRMVFNTTGSLFLENKVLGAYSNLLSGSNNTNMTGSDVLSVIFHTGSYAITASGGQYSPANKHLTGIYSASVNFDRFVTDTVRASAGFDEHINTSGSLKIYERWMDTDENVTFYSGSFDVKLSNTNTGTSRPQYKFSVTNLQKDYKLNEIHKIELFLRDDAIAHNPVRKNYSLKSLKINEAYYQVRDLSTGQKVIPFNETNNSTRISADINGMYFDFSTTGLPAGRSYTFDIRVKLGQQYTIYETNTSFRIEL